MQKAIGLLGGLLLLLGAGCSPIAEPSSIDSSASDSASSVSLDLEKRSSMKWIFPGTLPDDQIQNKQVRITTAKGDIVIRLFPDTAPMTVSNFVYLISNGYYDSLTFHRREEGFVLQGGDPNGTGTGGPGYTFADELEDERTYTRGIVAMANRGPDTNGSQFFIMLDDMALPKLYSIFGEVIEGMDVVDELPKGSVMTKVVVEDVK